MQYVARLHTTRLGVNRLQLSSYGNSIEVLAPWAKSILKSEPAGAWVQISELVEVPRRTYLKEVVNNETRITEMDHGPVTGPQVGGPGPEPSGKTDAKRVRKAE